MYIIVINQIDNQNNNLIISFIFPENNKLESIKNTQTSVKIIADDNSKIG